MNAKKEGGMEEERRKEGRKKRKRLWQPEEEWRTGEGRRMTSGKSV